MSLFDIFPLCEDISSSYRAFRRRGCGRDLAIQSVLDQNAHELNDVEDSCQVWIGLAKVLAEKRELTEEVLFNAEKSIESLSNYVPEAESELLAAKQRICNHNCVGKEAIYQKKRIYIPDWEIGDTFLYPIQSEYSKRFGLFGWNAIIRKIDSVMDPYDNLDQIVYLTLCRNDNIPDSSEQLERLGYLPFQAETGGYTYRASLRISSLRREKQYDLVKIGRFLGVNSPQNEIFGVIYPLFPATGNGDSFKSLSSIEIHSCLLYERFGIQYVGQGDG